MTTTETLTSIDDTVCIYPKAKLRLNQNEIYRKITKLHGCESLYFDRNDLVHLHESVNRYSPVYRLADS